MAKHATSTTMPAVQRRRARQSVHQQRQHLEAALERLLGAVEAVVADLDALDGDMDLEDGHDAEPACEDEGAQCDGGGAEEACEDEGAQCEDEGWDDDKEPDHEAERTVLYMLQHYPQLEAR